jgi:TonB family protein
MVAAAATHALIFALFLRWDVPLGQSRAFAEFVQLIPLPAEDQVSEIHVEPKTNPPRSDPPLPEERRLSADEMDPHPIEPVTPVIVVAFPNQRPIAGSLAGDHSSDLRVRLTATVPPIAWPEIVNPARMQRYLRSRYNTILSEDGVTGTVIVALWVDERGSVERAQVSESSGHPVLDDIALTLLGEVASFRPARDGVRPLAVQFTVAAPFATAW